MPLAHNHMTNLFVSSYRGATVLGSKGNSAIEVDKAVMSLPFDHVTLINLYISSYRETTGATFIHANG